MTIDRRGNLIITRKAMESIELDGGITVTIYSIEGGKVRISIRAPLSCGVRRGELPEAQDQQHVA